MAKIDIKRLAELGAGIRLREIAVEQAQIIKAFPGLTDRPRPAVATTRTRKPMTAAQRRAVSVRMKKYWKERRKAS